MLHSMWYTIDSAGCGFLRTEFPNLVLNSLYNNNQKYSGTVFRNFIGDGTFLKGMNIIHFQRHLNPKHIPYIRQIAELKRNRMINAGIIFDCDDLLDDIPPYNFAGKMPEMNPTYIKSALNIIFDSIDLFTVSTEFLKRRLQTIRGNRLNTCQFQVIPNLIPKFLYYRETEKKENDRPKIVWAGSVNHYSKSDMGDLGLIYELLKNTQNEFDWIFITGPFLPDQFNGIKLRHIPWIRNIFQYPRVLRELNADIGLAPLLPNDFNRAKSNIKILEYSACQAISLTSDLDPYSESQVYLKPTWQENRDLIIELFTNKVRKQEILDKQNTLLNKYWLEDNVEIYNNMIGLRL